MPWPGDHEPVRGLPIGTQNMRGPRERARCAVCGCDCSDTRVEFVGFHSPAVLDFVLPAGTLRPVEYVLVTTCLAHFAAPLAARLRAAGRR
jgi:hypothetical protein